MSEYKEFPIKITLSSKKGKHTETHIKDIYKDLSNNPQTIISDCIIGNIHSDTKPKPNGLGEWGWTSQTVWVNHGLRADFNVILKTPNITNFANTPNENEDKQKIIELENKIKELNTILDKKIELEMICFCRIPVIHKTVSANTSNKGRKYSCCATKNCCFFTWKEVPNHKEQKWTNKPPIYSSS